MRNMISILLDIMIGTEVEVEIKKLFPLSQDTNGHFLLVLKKKQVDHHQSIKLTLINLYLFN